MLTYILVFAGTFLFAGVVVFGTLMLRPDLLRGSATADPVVDSVTVKSAPKYLREYAGPTAQELAPPRSEGEDSIALFRDSINVLVAALSAERVKDHTLTEETHRDSVQVSQVVSDSSTEKLQKSRAKLLEAMPPENAAKIIANLSDQETKELLKYIKARQAAKILAAIQPDRASKLLR
ncbi:MAG: hypothetical protein WB699_11830 [Bacteroidota bacterium]